ncbi:hypothetical protein [Paraglaciecola chathamensis]|uniref:Uncharacterized protein n=1 Tax=Paraglaciecola chathamensis TaxID=368405 RepID=A0A8H9IHH1_9ALTE|nr:hypothetical protein [Paraglaciecola oceanifecundans]GGZ83243.1 hypothetical protein GCM10011274_46090 [Paraglaciecola oceanifecundans]
MIRFYCLFRSRMAKHEVIERLLARNISDGQWHTGEYDEADFLTKQKLALAEIRKCRKRYINRTQKENVTIIKLAEYPELKVVYDESLNGHYIQFPTIENGYPGVKIDCNPISLYRNVLGPKPALLQKPQTV